MPTWRNSTMRLIGWSSTTSRRVPSFSACSTVGGLRRASTVSATTSRAFSPCGSGSDAGSAIGMGRVSDMVVPFPSSLAISIAPPIRWASRCPIDNPSPVPPKVRVIPLPACANGWNRAACPSAEMPMPVSITENRTTSTPSFCSTRSARISIEPLEVNLIALLMRLLRICCSRRGSTTTAGLMRGST